MTETTSFCPNCGAARTGDARFCSTCGRPFVAPTETPAAGMSAEGAQQFVAWLIVIPSAVGFIWLWANTGPETNFGRFFVVGLLGLVWTGIVLFVIQLIWVVFGLGSVLFRRPRR